MFVLGKGRACQKNTDKFDILKTKDKRQKTKVEEVERLKFKVPLQVGAISLYTSFSLLIYHGVALSLHGVLLFLISGYSAFFFTLSVLFSLEIFTQCITLCNSV
jgi:hypothetical protein